MGDVPINLQIAVSLEVSLSPATLAAIGSKPQLDRIEAAIAQVLTKESTIMAAIDDLQAEVTRDTTVIGSAVTLINGFAAQLAAAGTDPAKLQALQNTLKTNVDALASAVAANTPAA